MDQFDFQRDACISYFYQISGNLIKYVDTFSGYLKCRFQFCFFRWWDFIFCSDFRSQSWLAITGALAYGLSSFFFQILGAGHNTQAIALAYMAPMIGGIYYTYRHDALKGALFTALFWLLKSRQIILRSHIIRLICLLFSELLNLFIH